jgi:hypothetical protein
MSALPPYLNPYPARAGTLAHVAEVLAPGGFLCFYDFMDVTPAMFWGLSQQCWGHSDEREYSLWCTFGRWERLLADAGFQQARPADRPRGGSRGRVRVTRAEALHAGSQSAAGHASASSCHSDNLCWLRQDLLRLQSAR